MGNKSLKWIISGIIAVFITIFILFMVSNSKEEYFNVVDIPTTHSIYNKTDKTYLDTIVSTGLSLIGVEPSIVIIKPLDDKISLNVGDVEMEVHAFIQASISPLGNQYLIYISDLSKKESIRVISHELIHMVQYDTGHLQIFGDSIIWHNKVYLYKDVPEYQLRQWEIDARGLSPILEKQIRNILIPKSGDIEK